MVSLIAGNAPGARLASVGGTTGKPQSIDAGAGQQYYAPEHVLTRFTIGDRSFGLALFPDGYRATIEARPLDRRRLRAGDRAGHRAAGAVLLPDRPR